MLDDAIRYYMSRKGLRPAALAGGFRSPHASSVSRVMRGITHDPHTTTLLHVCRLLEIDPTSLLTRAGMWTDDQNTSAAPSPDEQRVDQLCERVLALPKEFREVLWEQIEGMLRPLEAATLPRRSGRRDSQGP